MNEEGSEDDEDPVDGEEAVNDKENHRIIIMMMGSQWMMRSHRVRVTGLMRSNSAEDEGSMNHDELLDEEDGVDEDGGRMTRESVNEQECLRAVIWTALYSRLTHAASDASCFKGHKTSGPVEQWQDI